MSNITELYVNYLRYNANGKNIERELKKLEKKVYDYMYNKIDNKDELNIDD